MKIAVLTSSYPRYPGDGAAPFIQSICESLESSGYEVHVVAPYDINVCGGSGPKVSIHRFRYIWPSRLHIMGHARSLEFDTRLRPLALFLLPFFLTASFFSLFRIAKAIKASVIHAHWVLPNGLPAALVSKILRIPLVISLHGSDIYIATKNGFFARAAQVAFNQASAVTACSADLKDAAIKLGANPDKLYLLAWGADPEKFHPGFRRETLRKKFNENGQGVLIATLGRMVFKKGFDILIESMPAVLQKFPETKLVLGGDGLLRSHLEKKVSDLNLRNNITFSGKIPWDEVPQFLASSDIFVLPSVQDAHGNQDGLPTVLMEAMASGNAVIASKIAGIPLVIHDKQNGLLVAPGNSAELTEAILSLLEDPAYRFKLGDTARKSVLRQFNWKQVAKNFSSIFDTIIS